MPAIDFNHIRSSPKSKNDSFESLSTLLFRQTCAVPTGSTFYNVRGDGGDGGVEAYFHAPSGSVLGIQAKYFFRLDSAELQQIKESLTAALSNHPNLTQYWVYIPFDLTGRKGGGKLGKSQIERFDEWKSAVENKARSEGRHLLIVLCGASAIRTQLQAVDHHGGVRRYWFDDAVLTQTQIEACLSQAKAFAGPRYTSAVDVSTSAHETLDFFGGTGDLALWKKQVVRPFLVRGRSAGRNAAKVLSNIDSDVASRGADLLQRILMGLRSYDSASDMGSWASNIVVALGSLRPIVDEATKRHGDAFIAKYGADKDTPGFRQFHAEYMCSFPAGTLDLAREMQIFIDELEATLSSSSIKAASAQSLLLVGPAGAGKTHALVSAAERRLALGGFSLVVFGDDFGHAEPWQVLRTKLGFGSDVGRDTLLETMQACADSTGLPFLVAIDALNESPREARWKSKLPELLEQCRHYPKIRLCVSTRDTYRDLVVDARFPGFAFEHTGFAGNELEALEAFATHYGLDTEITPLFADELRNPLFLHLACRAMKEQGRQSLDVSLPGFTALFEGHLASCDKTIRNRLSYSNPRNVVRAAMQALAEAMVSSKPDSRTWDGCAAALRPIIGAEVTAEAMLGELQREGLIIVTGNDQEGFIVRVSYQRYGDVLRSLRLVEATVDSTGKVDIPALASKLKSLGPDEDGLLEVLSAVLPEKTGIEITHPGLGLPAQEAHTFFIKALTWRSRESLSTDIRCHVFAALETPGLWDDVYETAFRLSLVPDHSVNAQQWLHPFLIQDELANRDAFLSYAAVQSYEANGAVRSLIVAALKADMEVWPKESRSLAATVLGWLASCADRRLRDQATKGLTRLFTAHPSLAAPTLEQFSSCEDDYIFESLILAVYGALLLAKGKATEFAPALKAALLSGYDSPNVLIRDAVRLLSLELRAQGVLTADIELLLSHFPTKVAAPNPWPTEVDAKPLLAVDRLPTNMKLLGTQMLPDFWRYAVEPRIDTFDLASVGVSHENIAAWVMQHTYSELGYCGTNNHALQYDLNVSATHGSGRARKGYSERLGKKYYWISLHRIIGILSDNVPAKPDYDGTRRAPDTLWSVDVRKSDPTDVRDITKEATYPDSILTGPRYPFPDKGSDIKTWVRTDDFTPHAECLVRSANDGIEWVLLSFYARDDDRSDEDADWNQPYRSVSVDYSSILTTVSKPLKASALDRLWHSDSPHCYKVYLAEYPNSAAFAQCLRDGDTYLGPDGFQATEVQLMRGKEWEYDYSSDTMQEGLHVPCPELIIRLQLSWDHQRGWRSTDGELIAFEAIVERRRGLAIRRDRLNQYLTSSGLQLLVRRFANRGRMTGMSSGGIQLDLFTYLTYHPDGQPSVLAEMRQPYNC